MFSRPKFFTLLIATVSVLSLSACTPSTEGEEPTTIAVGKENPSVDAEIIYIDDLEGGETFSVNVGELIFISNNIESTRPADEDWNISVEDENVLVFNESENKERGVSVTAIETGTTEIIFTDPKDNSDHISISVTVED